MDDYHDDALDFYALTKQIEDLNRSLVEMRKENAILRASIEEYEKMPMPRTVLQQFIEMESKIRKLESDLDYYKNHVAPKVIINRESKNKSTRRGGIPK